MREQTDFVQLCAIHYSSLIFFIAWTKRHIDLFVPTSGLLSFVIIFGEGLNDMMVRRLSEKKMKKNIIKRRELPFSC